MKNNKFVTYLEKPVSQGSDEKDWAQFDAQVIFNPLELTLDTANTTDSSLCTYNYPMMKEGNNILLIDSANNITPFTLGTITASGTLQTLDPNHIGAKISLDSTNNIATRNSDSNTNTDSQIYGYAIDKGNVYWEVEYLAGADTWAHVGVTTDNTVQSTNFDMDSSVNAVGWSDAGWIAYKGTDSYLSPYGKPHNENNIRLGVRYCYESGELEFYYNGESQGIVKLLDPQTAVYPAISTYDSNSQVQLFSDPTTMLYLPDDCIPYGMLQYSADISSANLTKTPIKAFMDNRPLVFASMEAEENNLVQVITEKLKPILVGSTADKLITDNLLAGEELIIDDNEITIDSSKLTIDSNNNANYDISDLGLTKTPKQVFTKGYVELVKDTSTDSSFNGFSIHKFTPVVGDNVLTDKGVVQISNTPTVEDLSIIDSTDPFGDGSLLSKYLFNGNLNNIIDSGNNLTDVDSGLSYTPGVFDQAVVKNGNRIYFDDDVADLSGAFTISLWCYFDQNNKPANYFRIFDLYSKWDSAINITSDLSTIIITANNYSLNCLNFNKWHMLTLTYSDIPANAHTIKLYVDGALINSFDCDSQASKSYNSGLGSYYDSTTDYFMNRLDQVEIYKKELTDSEINTLYEWEYKFRYTLPLPSQSSPYEFAMLPPKTINVPQDTLTYDGTKFTNQHQIVKKQGRAIQRRIIMPDKYIEVLTPFTSNMWKEN